MPAAKTTDPRRIRSFIRRQGRITPAQRQALQDYQGVFCLDPEQAPDFHEIFQRKAPLFLEIGFGDGDCLADMAAANPDRDYIGIEVHRPGVGHLLLLLQQRGLSNVRIYCHDALDILEQCIPDDSLSGIHLFFPDPWPKKRHHKRRIVKPEFAELLAGKLHEEGYFHAATDWEDYAEEMLRVLNGCGSLLNTSPDDSYCRRPDHRPLTKFEQRGIRLGHTVRDLLFKKRSSPAAL